MVSPRRTKHGERIVELLAAQEHFLTAQEVHDALRAKDVKIGLATVYRQLQNLANEGAIDQLRTDDGQQAYRTCSEHHHHHLICVTCRRTEEINDDRFEPLVKSLAEKHGFILVEHELELRGLCKNCRLSQ